MHKLEAKIFELYNNMNNENQKYFDDLIYTIRYSTKDPSLVEETLYEIANDILLSQEKNINAYDYFKIQPENLGKLILNNLPDKINWEIFSVFLVVIISVGFLRKFNFNPVRVDFLQLILTPILFICLTNYVLKLFLDSIFKKNATTIQYIISFFLFLCTFISTFIETPFYFEVALINYQLILIIILCFISIILFKYKNIYYIYAITTICWIIYRIFYPDLLSFEMFNIFMLLFISGYSIKQILK